MSLFALLMGGLTPHCLTTLGPRSLVSAQISVANPPGSEPAFRPALLRLSALIPSRLRAAQLRTREGPP